MAIPTEVEFIDCLGKIDGYPLSIDDYPDEEACRGWKEATVDGFFADRNFLNFKLRNRAACEESLSFVFDALSKKRREIFDGAVMRWLTASTEYSSVYAKLFPNGFKVRSEDEVVSIRNNFIELSYERLCKAANTKSARELRMSPAEYLHERRRLFRHQSESFRWIRGLVSAIREYHFSNVAELMVDRRRSYDVRILKAIEAVEVLRSIANDDVAMRVVGVLYDGRNPLRQFKAGDANEERIEKLIECFRDMSKVDADTLYPISRLDGTARARVFVYRMAEENWREFQSSKPGQIADLMYLEGFDVQLDQRTIERQCKNFDSMERKYWTQVRATRGGAAYMERLQRWRQLSKKNG
ncbi:hypothetical protein LGM71_19170 [Burkholderia sp. AU33545]|uniref:hypothetical protein n=1 Tax=Burkholderia sp. AU33545 TaxID=2879631 RepID=UPI001CF5FE7C|nr:hypothetical protein [Burkholderia sp. AU33545]MCA8203176.1 hypothetical protein [Burkholderia sp. AU33545]